MYNVNLRLTIPIILQKHHSITVSYVFFDVESDYDVKHQRFVDQKGHLSTFVCCQSLVHVP